MVQDIHMHFWISCELKLTILTVKDNREADDHYKRQVGRMSAPGVQVFPMIILHIMHSSGDRMRSEYEKGWPNLFSLNSMTALVSHHHYESMLSPE